MNVEHQDNQSLDRPSQAKPAGMGRLCWFGPGQPRVSKSVVAARSIVALIAIVICAIGFVSTRSIELLFFILAVVAVAAFNISRAHFATRRFDLYPDRLELVFPHKSSVIVLSKITQIGSAPECIVIELDESKWKRFLMPGKTLTIYNHEFADETEKPEFLAMLYESLERIRKSEAPIQNP